MTDKQLPHSVYPDLAGRVALVTGSSRGIGAETARYLAANNVKVVINGRQAKAVERVVAEINERGGTAIGCIADCSKAEQIEEMRARMLAARAARERPGLDDKVLSGWNALAISGLVRA